MPPRYSPSDEPDDDLELSTESPARRMSRVLAATVIIAVMVMVSGGLRRRRG